MKRLLTLALLAAGCATPLTSSRLSPSFTTTFAALYVSQQQLIGRTDVIRGQLRALGSCRRTGPSTTGPGEDWQCTVQSVDTDTTTAQTFEVQLKPDGCWKADGPPTSQPAQLADAATGQLLTNPLAEFDGCLDASW